MERSKLLIFLIIISIISSCSNKKRINDLEFYSQLIQFLDKNNPSGSYNVDVENHKVSSLEFHNINFTHSYLRLASFNEENLGFTFRNCSFNKLDINKLNKGCSFLEITSCKINELKMSTTDTFLHDLVFSGNTQFSNKVIFLNFNDRLKTIDFSYSDFKLLKFSSKPILSVGILKLKGARNIDLDTILHLFPAVEEIDISYASDIKNLKSLKSFKTLKTVYSDENKQIEIKTILGDQNIMIELR